MNLRKLLVLTSLAIGLLALSLTPTGFGQPGGERRKDSDKGGPFGRGPGGPGGMMGQTRKIVKDFDKDGDGRLNATERAAARESLKNQGGGRPGMGKMGFGRGNQEPVGPGPKVSPEDVKPIASASLYDPDVLRTLFLDFEEKDWEAELQDFHGTDVEVPCTLTVDGKKYPNVGVHFRGMSSYMMVSAGRKRSLNLSLDFVDSKQRLYGYKTLNLLNSHEDPGMMSTVLYSHVARKYIPAPNANYVKVVINGESWGVYVNAQQFNKDFLKENYKTSKGTRWKVRGNPGARGGLEYLGENIEDYKRHYEMKSRADEKAWRALINFCKVLNQTPADKLEEALKPICDIDGLLWFIALDIGVMNDDGYWTRSSDYSIYLDDKGKFHFIPSDMNECFRAGGGGPGGPGGPGGGGRGGFGMRMPRPGEVLPEPVQEMLRMTDGQKKKLDELQREVEAKLDKILTKEQRDQFKAMREAGPFGGPRGFGPPGGGPGGFGPPGGGPGGFGPPGGGPGGDGPPGGGPGGFGPPGGDGPGGFGPPGGGPGGASSVNLDPFTGLNARFPLRSKVLAVPSLRKKYLEHLRQFADEALDWKTLGPVVAKYRKLIEKEVAADTRKLDSLADFKKVTADNATTLGRGQDMPLRAFADARRKYLLDYKETQPSAGP